MADRRRAVPGASLLGRTAPITLLTVATAGAAIAAALVLTRHRAVAGVVALVAAVALLSGASRPRQDGWTRVRIAELVVDRVFDASVLLPLAWVDRGSSEMTAALALFGFGASFVASYERARGESLGYPGFEGLGYRLARELILVLALLTGFVTPLLATFLALTAAATATRAWNVRRHEREPLPARPQGQ